MEPFSDTFGQFLRSSFCTCWGNPTRKPSAKDPQTGRNLQMCSISLWVPYVFPVLGSEALDQFCSMFNAPMRMSSLNLCEFGVQIAPVDKGVGPYCRLTLVNPPRFLLMFRMAKGFLVFFVQFGRVMVEVIADHAWDLFSSSAFFYPLIRAKERSLESRNCRLHNEEGMSPAKL